ncbi:unnamed protein product [Brachionus calyciflorus]|uniref:Uncharacterized protein n=1 Tax=Brachionus calyciflorus TaxID=104777 RepID=A0A814C5K2_9BILA|nr:unnamed protein product [Brachionus calyciflorus]
MAVEIFKKQFVEANLAKASFSFEALRKSLSTLTPNKKGKSFLSYDLVETDIIQHSKEAIIRNLCLHPILIERPNIDVETLRNFYEFMQDNTFSESRLAQCFYLLHGSKSDYSSFELSAAILEIQNYFSNFSTIDTNVNTTQYDFLTDLTFIFHKTIQGSNVQKIINEKIDEIVFKNDQFDYNQVKLVYFNSNIDCVDGFSGRNTVYINLNPLLRFNNFKINEKKKNIALKLSFLSLIIHEISHNVLRFKLKDLNISSPFLVGINDKDIKKNISECGYEIEIQFFKHIINWPASANDINTEYCENYLDNILDDNYVEIDINEARLLTIALENVPKMGFKYHLIRHSYRL